MFVYLINMEQVRVCLMLYCVFSLQVTTWECVSLLQKKTWLTFTRWVGWSLHGATPSVVYLRKHIYADVDPGDQAVHLESEPCYEFTLAYIKHYQKTKCIS